MGSTKIRAEVSEKNKYYISKHRYYELKHMCLQYSEWEEKYAILSNKLLKAHDNTVGIHGSHDGDYISEIASKMALYSGKMEMVRKTCKDADDQICDYIFKAVTEDLSYVYLSTVLEIPCGRDMFYDRYRKFYAILDKIAE